MAEAQETETSLKHLWNCDCQDLSAVGTKDACLSTLKKLFKPSYPVPFAPVRVSSPAMISALGEVS